MEYDTPDNELDLDDELAMLLASYGIDAAATEPTTDVENHPGGPNCPDWCVMGVDGDCTSDFWTPDENDPDYVRAKAEGWAILWRKRRKPNGLNALELVLANDRPGGRHIRWILEEGSPEYESLRRR